MKSFCNGKGILLRGVCDGMQGAILGSLPCGDLLESYYSVNTVDLRFSFQNDYPSLLSPADGPIRVI